MSLLPAAESWPCVLRTPRLILRPAESGDVSEFTRLWTDPDVRRFLGGPVAEDQLTTYQQHFAGRPHVFTVVTRQEATVLGSVSIDPNSRFDGRREVSYSFLPEHWGQGYAREAVTAAVGWCLDHVPSDDPSVIAVTQEANARSRRLLEAIGMRMISTFVEWDAPQTMYSVPIASAESRTPRRTHRPPRGLA
ncbi:GNAT family N-acetyltransferase [Streptomyces sp. NPDC020298]|uniref:GNAT family N-acetyltransferase n=1 Tax=unclassified Streptomyces TaxID=2593676 RepID=UPI00340974FB